MSAGDRRLGRGRTGGGGRSRHEPRRQTWQGADDGAVDTSPGDRRPAGLTRKAGGGEGAEGAVDMSPGD